MSLVGTIQLLYDLICKQASFEGYSVPEDDHGYRFYAVPDSREEVEQLLSVVSSTVFIATGQSEEAQSAVGELACKLGPLQSCTCGSSRPDDAFTQKKLNSYLEIPDPNDYSPSVGVLAQLAAILTGRPCSELAHDPAPLRDDIEPPQGIANEVIQLLQNPTPGSMFWGGRCLYALSSNAGLDSVVHSFLRSSALQVDESFAMDRHNAQRTAAPLAAVASSVRLSLSPKWPVQLNIQYQSESPLMATYSFLELLHQISGQADRGALRTALLHTFTEASKILDPRFITVENIIEQQEGHSRLTDIAAIFQDIIRLVAEVWIKRKKHRLPCQMFVLRMGQIQELLADEQTLQRLDGVVTDICQTIYSRETGRDPDGRCHCLEALRDMFTAQSMIVSHSNPIDKLSKSAVKLLQIPIDLVPQLSEVEVECVSGILNVLVNSQHTLTLRVPSGPPPSPISQAILMFSVSHISSFDRIPSEAVTLMRSVFKSVGAMFRTQTSPLRASVAEQDLQLSTDPAVNEQLILAAFSLFDTLRRPYAVRKWRLTSHVEEMLQCVRDLLRQPTVSQRVISTALGLLTDLVDFDYSSVIDVLDIYSVLLTLPLTLDPEILRLYVDSIERCITIFKDCLCREFAFADTGRKLIVEPRDSVSYLEDTEEAHYIAFGNWEVLSDAMRTERWAEVRPSLEAALLRWMVVIDGRMDMIELFPRILLVIRLLSLPEFRFIDIMALASRPGSGRRSLPSAPDDMYRRWYETFNPFVAAAHSCISLGLLTLGDVIPAISQGQLGAFPAAIASQVMTSHCQGSQTLVLPPPTGFRGECDRRELPIVSQSALLACRIDDWNCSLPQLLTPEEQAPLDWLRSPAVVAADLPHRVASRLTGRTLLLKEGGSTEAYRLDVGSWSMTRMPPHSIMPHLTGLVEVMRVGRSDKRVGELMGRLDLVWGSVLQPWLERTDELMVQFSLSTRQANLFGHTEEPTTGRVGSQKTVPFSSTQSFILWSSIMHYLSLVSELHTSVVVQPQRTSERIKWAGSRMQRGRSFSLETHDEGPELQVLVVPPPQQQEESTNLSSLSSHDEAGEHGARLSQLARSGADYTDERIDSEDDPDAAFVHDEDYERAFGEAEAGEPEDGSTGVYQDALSDAFSSADGAASDPSETTTTHSSAVPPSSHHPHSTKSTSYAGSHITPGSVFYDSEDMEPPEAPHVQLQMPELSGAVRTVLEHLLKLLFVPKDYIVVSVIGAIARLSDIPQAAFCVLLFLRMTTPRSQKTTRSELYRQIHLQAFDSQILIALAAMVSATRSTPMLDKFLIMLTGVWTDCFAPLPPTQMDRDKLTDRRLRDRLEITLESPALSLYHPPSDVVCDLTNPDNKRSVPSPSLSHQVIEPLPLYWPRRIPRIPRAAIVSLLTLISAACKALRRYGSDDFDNIASQGRTTPRLSQSALTLSHGGFLVAVPPIPLRIFATILALDSAPASDDVVSDDYTVPPLHSPQATTAEYWLRPFSALVPELAAGEQRRLSSMARQSSLVRSPDSPEQVIASDVAMIEALAAAELSFPVGAQSEAVLYHLFRRLTPRGVHTFSALSKVAGAYFLSQGNDGMCISKLCLGCIPRLPQISSPLDLSFVPARYRKRQIERLQDSMHELIRTEILTRGITRAALVQAGLFFTQHNRTSGKMAFIQSAAPLHYLTQLSRSYDQYDESGQLTMMGYRAPGVKKVVGEELLLGPLAHLLWFIIITIASPFALPREIALSFTRSLIRELGDTFAPCSPLLSALQGLPSFTTLNSRSVAFVQQRFIRDLAVPAISLQMVLAVPILLADSPDYSFSYKVLTILPVFLRQISLLSDATENTEEAEMVVDALISVMALSLTFQIPGSDSSHLLMGPLEEPLRECVLALLPQSSSETLSTVGSFITRHCVQSMASNIGTSGSQSQTALKYQAVSFILHSLSRSQVHDSVQRELEEIVNLPLSLDKPFTILEGHSSNDDQAQCEAAALLLLDLAIHEPCTLDWSVAAAYITVLCIAAAARPLVSVTAAVMLGASCQPSENVALILAQLSGLLVHPDGQESIVAGYSTGPHTFSAPTTEEHMESQRLLPSALPAWKDSQPEPAAPSTTQRCMLFATFLGSLQSELHCSVDIERVATAALAYALHERDDATQAAALDLFFATAALGAALTGERLCAVAALVLNYCGINPVTSKISASPSGRPFHASSPVAGKAAAWLAFVMSAAFDAISGAQSRTEVYSLLESPHVAVLPPLNGPSAVEDIAAVFRLIGGAMVSTSDSAVYFTMCLLDRALGVSYRIQSGSEFLISSPDYVGLVKLVGGALSEVMQELLPVSGSLSASLECVASKPYLLPVTCLILCSYLPFYSSSAILTAGEIARLSVLETVGDSDRLSITIFIYGIFCSCLEPLAASSDPVSFSVARALIELLRDLFTRADVELTDEMLDPFNVTIDLLREGRKSVPNTVIEKGAETLDTLAHPGNITKYPAITSLVEVLTICLPWRVCFCINRCTIRPTSIRLLSSLCHRFELQSVTSLSSRIARVARILPPSLEQAELMTAIDAGFVGHRGQPFQEPATISRVQNSPLKFLVYRVSQTPQIIDRLIVLGHS